MKEYKDGVLVDTDEAISPEEAKEQFNLINRPSTNHSQAHESKITSVDEDNSQAREQNEKYKALSDKLGVTQQREEIDKLTQSVQYLISIQEQYKQVIEQHSQILQQLAGGAQPQVTPTAANPNPTMGDMDLSKLKEASDALGPILDRIWPKETAQAPSIIDQQMINDKMKQNFMDNIETGESINNFIKNSLKKTVTKNVINSSLKDIGTQALEHGP